MESWLQNLPNWPSSGVSITQMQRAGKFITATAQEWPNLTLSSQLLDMRSASVRLFASHQVRQAEPVTTLWPACRTANVIALDLKTKIAMSM